MKIEKSQYGYWLTRDGKSHYVPFGDPLADKIKAALKGKRRLILDIPENRVVQGGFYQKSVYYRDEEGRICIPPDPKMVPKGFEAKVVKNEREANALNRELTAQLSRQFEGDQMTEFMDAAQGDPRKHLLQLNPISNFERDMVCRMIEVLDQEERDRNRVSVDHHFAWQGT